jgi:uroporphyrinogen-III synthase
MSPPRVLYTGLRAPGEVAGLLIDHLPLLSSAPLPIDPAPLQALLLAAPCALVCASPRSPATIAALRLGSGSHAHIGWAVGQRTALALRDALPWLTAVHTPPDDAQHFSGLCAALEAAHRADALPPHIIALALEDSPRDLAHALSHLPALHITTVEVYATAARPPHELTALPASLASASWVVLTSPRGADALHAATAGQRPAARIAAIGPTTAAALHELGWPPDLTPPTPSLDALWPLLTSD